MSENSTTDSNRAVPAGGPIRSLTAEDFAFARELADPNFSLSVPAAAKTMLTRLLADVKASQKREAEVATALGYTLQNDGAHHKQWGLETIAELFGIEHDNEGIAP